MRFRIGEKTYTTAAVGRLTLRQLIQIEHETTQLGRPMSWQDLREIAGRVEKLPGDKAGQDPDWLWFVALVIWSSRVDAGEQITFTDAIDFPIDELEWLPEPQDRKKSADPTKARPGSGRAGSGAAAAGRGKGRKKTSAKG